MQLSADEVLQLSPDDSSTKAAKGLVVPAKWPTLSFDADAVWGECQGSGSKPYQVQVDKSGPAFRCTCPSRKFPCKHGLALLLLLAQVPDKFVQSSPPAWVSEWLDSRKQRAEKQAAKQADTASTEAATSDPQAAARRDAQRQTRMQGGIDELERWLNDRLREGLAQLPGRTSQWDELATRMIDAQLPGLAYQLRRIGAAVSKGEDWPARVLGGLGQLRLLIDAFSRIETLPEPVQADLRYALGLPVDRETVAAAGEQIEDDWVVLGQCIDEDGRLWVRRVWLRGSATGRYALLLDYAHGSRRFDQSFLTSSRLRMRLAFYPGNAPLRAIVLGEAAQIERVDAPPTLTLDESLNTLALAEAANPWQAPQPMLFSNGVPRHDAHGWWLQTTSQQIVPIVLPDEEGWILLAESGGEAISVFGEWQGGALRLLSAWKHGLFWVQDGVAA
ncbi:SWIM zinc finger family protein [Niveibacterium sp. 24ML]|uniref:SWIM zinc finger family protein n=1 Tax=Niveibacterium sp. 24ML TaxID=2985512 RepID=UPI00226FA110|nr:SWIM zinc finger family protein [Niveibacterium sp. 24ML]MCX9155626.1 SWIM zinc finger family protein [Niveibacterium sp. 24ML]